MDYLLKASAVLTIFYVCYIWFLQRETFFNSNRWFLLIGQFFAFLLPLLVIPIYVTVAPEVFKASSRSNMPITAASVATLPSIETVLIWIYIAGVVFFFGKFTINILSLSQLVRSQPSKKMAGIYYTETTNTAAPFSFFNNIVYNPHNFSAKELELILNHERVHVRQWHSADVLISQLSCVVLWFNPVSWLYKKAVQQNLEFIADGKTQSKAKCQQSYQRLLLKVSLPTKHQELVNSFNSSLIKKRIYMLQQSKSNTLKSWKYALLIPVLALFLMSFNTQEVYISEATFQAQNSSKKHIVTASTSDADLAKIESDMSNTHVVLKFSDISRNADNTIREIYIKTKHSGGSRYNKRVTVKNDKQKTIKPFSLQLTANKQDILFQFSDDEATLVAKDRITFGKEATTRLGTQKTLSEADGLGENPLYIINGKTYRKETLKHPAHFTTAKSITIINKKEGLKRYGAAGKDGVIIFEGISGFKTLDTATTKPHAGEAKPLILLNDEEITREKMDSIDPKTIIKTDVITNAAELEKYGSKAKDGVIIISTGDTDTKLMEIPENPLILIDGKEATQNDMQAINPENIQNVRVLKPEMAKATYGKKGTHGAILVTTKP
ncbi:M56 family metallopeptidase [Bizionia sediminis]|uniref:M56 family metallopeptidase n=1 Tax=Bizionia sediminis TaxID=1737064 RepID=A0ABW5KNA0_9FLAO